MRGVRWRNKNMAGSAPSEIKKLKVYKYLDLIKTTFDQLPENDWYRRDSMLLKILEEIGEYCYLKGQEKIENELLNKSNKPF